MVQFLKAILSVILSVLCGISSFIFGDFTADFTPEDAENCNLNFAVMSDIHMTDSAYRKLIFKMGLSDLENAESRLDALVFAGDMTDHGEREHYEALYECFSKYDPADNIVLAVGNHDTWNESAGEENSFVESEKLFFEYNKKIANRDIEKVYYSTVINGYTFIVMSSEGDSTAGYVSDTQLQWLDDELAKASQTGLPIFVISHWPLKNTHGLPVTWLDNPLFETWDELDENSGSYQDNRSDDVKAILKKYNDVFYITGHLHSGLADNFKGNGYSYSSVESDGSLHLVNLPSYMFGNAAKGRIANGTGFSFEVYDDEVLIRGRSFSAGVWYTQYDFRIPLV